LTIAAVSMPAFDILNVVQTRAVGAAALACRRIRLPTEGMPMTRAYNVVDADGHILEPLDLWDNYIDPEFRERRPRFVIDENGKERLSVEGKLLGNPRGIGSLGAVGVRQGDVKLDSLKYAEGKKGG
jgi:hypothetical protein